MAVLFVRLSRRLQPAAVALVLVGAVQLAQAVARPQPAPVTHVRMALKPL